MQLVTETITESAFRVLAGLCSKCGIGRVNHPDVLCELCLQEGVLKFLATLKAPKQKRKKAA